MAMQPIFISYSSKHRDLTRELAEVLEGQYGAGSVWWDHALESRASYSAQIKAALEKARVVVVIWTSGAMISDYVYAEAIRALEQGKLVNVRPADMSFRDIPEPFNIHHIDEAADPARILSTIAKVMAGTPIPTRVPLHEIYYPQHGHRLIDPKQSTLAADPREVSPSELLQARFGVVGYVEVSGIRADLLDWCTGGARRSAGRLVHGPGGLGKTRLLIEVAAALRRRGWTAGFLERPHEQFEATLKQRWQALDQLVAHGEDDGLLIVIDYAEGRQDEVRRVADRLSQRPETDTRPIRVMLLTRSAGEWWTTLHEDNPEVQRLFRGSGLAPDVIAIEEIASAPQRLELFQASLRAFGPPLAAQGYVLPTGAPSPEHLRRIETGSGYTRSLAVQMEALLWLAAAAPEPGAPVDDLLGRVLGFERSHWRKLLGTLDEVGVRDVARGVAQVTAVHGVSSRGSAERLLMADDFYHGQRTARVAVDPVVRNLSRVYGRPDGGLAHLEPDLIGEHHVATVGDVELLDGCLHWIATEPPDAQEQQRRRDLVTVLQRATQPEHGAGAAGRAITLLDYLVSAHLKSLATAMVAVMIDTPGALAERLQRHIETLDDESLGAIDTALPLQSLSLMHLSLHVAVRRAALARELLAAADAAGDATGEPRESILHHLAARAGTLGIRLSNLGRREEALAASQEAVELYRRLAASRPDAFLPDLARSVSATSDILAALNRPMEAAQAAHQALEILAPFVERYPATFGDLARYVAGQVLRYNEAAGQPPDETLLERVARALGGTGTSEEDAAIKVLGKDLRHPGGG
jgi:hypothetical protein